MIDTKSQLHLGRKQSTMECKCFLCFISLKIKTNGNKVVLYGHLVLGNSFMLNYFIYLLFALEMPGIVFDLVLLKAVDLISTMIRIFMYTTVSFVITILCAEWFMLKFRCFHNAMPYSLMIQNNSRLFMISGSLQKCSCSIGTAGEVISCVAACSIVVAMAT